MKELKDLMPLGNMKNIPYMLLLTTPDGKVLSTNILNITIISILEALTSVFLLSPLEEKLKLIISSFLMKYGPGSKLMVNNTLTLL